MTAFDYLNEDQRLDAAVEIYARSIGNRSTDRERTVTRQAKALGRRQNRVTSNAYTDCLVLDVAF